jgi:type 1 glutamine amidotransferase
MKKIFTFLAALLLTVTLHAAPKKILVVETTTGFRHSSIPTGEKILAQLASDTGAFTLDFVRQPPGHAATGFPVKLKPDATEEEKKAFAEAEAKWNEALKTALQKLSPESLKNYDAVLFLSTTGDLPIPDKQGFLDWIKAGHAFIGIHAAGDTFHGWPDFIEMIGGEFQTHPSGTYPACRHLGATWNVNDEIYLFKNYDAAKVHELLILDKHPKDKTPGHFPVSWSKEYGKGKVFYTSLGHREDLWDTDPDIKDRKNPIETSKAYQAHVLGGIKWALGLDAGAAPAKKE